MGHSIQFDVISTLHSVRELEFYERSKLGMFIDHLY